MYPSALPLIEQLNSPIGAAWLALNYHVQLVGNLPVLSQAGGRRTTRTEGEVRIETWPERMRPEDTPAAHLQFHLRHEVPHLEFLRRVFERSGPAFLQTWIENQPTGQYARRASFLYEWLTKQTLTAPVRIGGNYVDALDETKLVVSSPAKVVRVPRWRVNDNLPGTSYFCPLIVKTAALREAAALAVGPLYRSLEVEFGADLLVRSAVWMTLRESRASFAIEGEANQAGRVQRFAHVMESRIGRSNLPLDEEALASLQRDILGARTTLSRFGLRQSPVFVGQTLRSEEIVHYVAPPSEEVPLMLEGLRVFLDKTQGQSSVIRSTIASFGFVYIHPLADGNGRVHRFLINDILRRDGVLPAPVILPLSTTITRSAEARSSYDQVLDKISKPLMQTIREKITFSPTPTRYPDGVTSNFVFTDSKMAQPLWRYLDLTPHVLFVADLIKKTLTVQIPEQSRYFRQQARARAALKEVVEIPDHQADRVLRSIQQNQGNLSNALSKEIPILAKTGVWEDIVASVDEVLGLGKK